MECAFLHMKNTFSRRSIELLFDHVKKIHSQEVLVYHKNVSYDENSGSITPLHNQSNSQSCFEDIKDHLTGYNFNVNSNNRTVFQLYNAIQNRELALNDQKLQDGTVLGRLYSRESMNVVKNFFAKNKQVIENLVCLNKKLYPFLTEYPIHQYTKLFANMPNCPDQELHCDFPDETEHRNTIYIIIPLNDCDKDMGTTVFYDNNYVGKYFVKDESWYNKGKIENLDENVKEEFKLAEYNVPFKIGDAVIFFGDSIHRGTRNQSGKIRYFLHMAWRKN
jgi:ectoine hydroxylase-related dioxygenase (phytanoyl-CoA dioxygenase family)